MAGDRAERFVVKNHKGRDPFFLREFHTEEAEPFEELRIDHLGFWKNRAYIPFTMRFRCGSLDCPPRYLFHIERAVPLQHLLSDPRDGQGRVVQPFDMQIACIDQAFNQLSH